ncbi:MAG: zinc-binding dehydrogenase [Steroidobacteraceae bacterium]
MVAEFRKIVIRELTGDFRSSTVITSERLRQPQGDEVLIRNRFAGCNAVFDKNLCRNAIRYVDVVPPFDMGIEAIGEIVATGPGVSGLVPGMAVATSRLGSGYREYQLAPAARVIPVREASAEILTLIPTGVSALVGLEKIGELASGETVAVSAAAGGLGHIVVQLAKLAGNHVIALTGSSRKVAMLETLGADRVVDLAKEDLQQVLQREYPRGINLAYDSVGGPTFDALLDNLAMRGRLVISGHTSDFDQPLENVPQPRVYRKLYWKSASVRGFQNPAFPEHFDWGVARILELYYAGKLKAWVDQSGFTGLDSVADAVEYLLAGRNTGKVVIRL